MGLFYDKYFLIHFWTLDRCVETNLFEQIFEEYFKMYKVKLKVQESEILSKTFLLIGACRSTRFYRNNCRGRMLGENPSPPIYSATLENKNFSA